MIIWQNEKRLKETLEEILHQEVHSNFYREKISEHDGDLTSLPFLSRAELVEVLPEERLYCPQEKIAFVAFTSGTTSGKPLVSYFSEIENYFFEPSLSMGIKRPLITYPPLNKNFGGTFIQQCRQAKSKVTPIFADFQNLPNSAIIAKETSADAIYATPTIAINLAEHIEKYYDKSAIKLLALSSETLTKSQRTLLQEKYPQAKIANLYASSEIGQFILYPCKNIIDDEKEEFHILSEALTALELIDNELVVTYTLNKAFPLIRYKTGDYFEIARERCDCGIEGPTLKWSGRPDIDRLRISGFEIKPESLEEVFDSIDLKKPIFYQAHFYNEEIGGMNKIRVVLEIKNSNQSDLTMRQEITAPIIKEALLKNWQISANLNLESAIQKGIFSDVEIKFVEELSIKGEKVRRLVNHIK